MQLHRDSFVYRVAFLGKGQRKHPVSLCPLFWGFVLNLAFGFPIFFVFGFLVGRRPAVFRGDEPKVGLNGVQNTVPYRHWPTVGGYRPWPFVLLFVCFVLWLTTGNPENLSAVAAFGWKISLVFLEIVGICVAGLLCILILGLIAFALWYASIRLREWWDTKSCEMRERKYSASNPLGLEEMGVWGLIRARLVALKQKVCPLVEIVD